MITNNQWDLLIERSLTNHIATCSSLYPIDDPEELSFHEARIRMDLRSFFATFQEHRTGPAKPFNFPTN
ncbi:MAG: hypothetical protein D6690_14645 [Nitrospirae bacterium]|nr:MAG: hypothetical protein D6690_14645 [Nitrospirota bacterium]